MKQLDDYFKLRKEIYDYFGYRENWGVIPLNDDRQYYWCLPEGDDSEEVHFAKNKENLEKIIAADYDYEQPDIDKNDYYTNEIYTQQFLPKWVYRGEDYTLICVDTRTDGNKFLSVYDNKKEIKEADHATSD